MIFFQALLREIISLLSRVREKIQDKFFWNKHEIKESHLYIRSFIEHWNTVDKDTFPIRLSQQDLPLSPFKKGFNSRTFVYSEEKNTKPYKWIIKVGHRISPVIHFGDPSDPEHAVTQLNHYNILEKITKDLPFLLVKPQFIAWIQHPKKNEGRTIIMQPFLTILSREKILSLPASIKKELLQELLAFEDVVENVKKNYNLFPDLMGEDNIAVVQHVPNSFHFVLLDTGMLELEKPIPLTKTALFMAYNNEISILKRILS